MVDATDTDERRPNVSCGVYDPGFGFLKKAKVIQQQVNNGHGV